MKIAFSKWQGAGNDYLFVVDRDAPTFDYARAAALLSPRRLSVGADGLVVLTPGVTHDRLTMHMYNADGSEGNVCGNALRAAAALWYSRQTGTPETLIFTCKAGERAVTVLPSSDGSVREAVAEMGRPALLSGDCRALGGGEELAFTLVDVGNRHAVFFDPPATLDLAAIGARMERLGDCNTEFVTPLAPARFAVRVFERGSGETLACGSGCTAVAFAAAQKGFVPPGTPVSLVCPGGILTVTLREDGTALLRGPVTHVYDGIADLPDACALPRENGG